MTSWELKLDLHDELANQVQKAGLLTHLLKPKHFQRIAGVTVVQAVSRIMAQ